MLYTAVIQGCFGGSPPPRSVMAGDLLAAVRVGGDHKKWAIYEADFLIHPIYPNYPLTTGAIFANFNSPVHARVKPFGLI